MMEVKYYGISTLDYLCFFILRFPVHYSLETTLFEGTSNPFFLAGELASGYERGKFEVCLGMLREAW